MAQRVLVTGGAGFIGSHLCELLCARGFEVRVLDNLSFGRRDWLPAPVDFVLGDITDPEICKRACDGVDGVFHAAAMSRAAPSLEAIDACTRQNIAGTQNMLLAARDAGVKRFIYSGSSTYYGNQAGPHREDMRPQFLNFYALSKYVGEEYCQLFDRVFDLPVVVLRYFNVYGPRQPQSGAYALVLGIFLSRWRHGQTLEIHGSGEQRRDFIHVRDVAAANLAAYQSAIHGVALNVGSGVNISVQELADMISPDQVHVARRAGDAEVTLADISRTTALLGWRPRIDFPAGLEELKQQALHGLD
jgi:nucleoside-diphosphate-sugar epimerase